MRGCKLVLFLSMVFQLSGCVYGLLYTSKTEPLVTNMRSTPVGQSEGSSGTKMVSLPVTTANLSAEWSSRAIGDAANKAGLTEIYYADLYTFSVLAGIWQERTIKVYGK